MILLIPFLFLYTTYTHIYTNYTTYTHIYTSYTSYTTYIPRGYIFFGNTHFFINLVYKSIFNIFLIYF